MKTASCQVLLNLSRELNSHTQNTADAGDNDIGASGWWLNYIEFFDDEFIYRKQKLPISVEVETASNNNNDRLTAFDPGQPG